MRRLPSWIRLLGPFLGLFVVIAVFSLLTWWKGTLGDFLSTDNFNLILPHATITAVAGLGMTIIMIMGGIDLSVGYVISLVTVLMMLAFRWTVQGGGAATGSG
ncbi:MAG TPA: hypothetical protein PKD72_08580, partial [Gemmatales bacterium]|nr:hypothetical protein [Gemmatales bacterium]